MDRHEGLPRGEMKDEEKHRRLDGNRREDVDVCNERVDEVQSWSGRDSDIAGHCVWGRMNDLELQLGLSSRSSSEHSRLLQCTVALQKSALNV